MEDKTLQQVQEIGQIIYDKKGMNILALDVQGLSSITDYMIFAEGNVDRHVKAIHNAIREGLKKEGELPLYVDGLDTCEWLVMDYGTVMIHLFTPAMREKYGLEKVWKEANIVDLNLTVGNSAA